LYRKVKLKTDKSETSNKSQRDNLVKYGVRVCKVMLLGWGQRLRKGWDRGGEMTLLLLFYYFSGGLID